MEDGEKFNWFNVLGSAALVGASGLLAVNYFARVVGGLRVCLW